MTNEEREVIDCAIKWNEAEKRGMGMHCLGPAVDALILARKTTYEQLICVGKSESGVEFRIDSNTSVVVRGETYDIHSVMLKKHP